jgi:hypothetical protein
MARLAERSRFGQLHKESDDVGAPTLPAFRFQLERCRQWRNIKAAGSGICNFKRPPLERPMPARHSGGSLFGPSHFFTADHGKHPDRCSMPRRHEPFVPTSYFQFDGS